MISSHYDEHSRSGQVIIRPNQSWTWRANGFFIGTLLAISFLIATVFTLRGYWLILPFTLLEMAVLAGCLYYCVRRTHTQEVLRLTRDRLTFERGIKRPTQVLQFDRYFARFLVEPARHPWYRKRVELKCGNRQLEVGRGLSDADRDQLVAALRDIIHRLDAPPASL